MSRERLGIIQRGDGQTFEVILLKVADLSGVNLAAPDLALELAARSLRISRKEFEEWDITDAMKVIDLVSRGLTALGKL